MTLFIDPGSGPVDNATRENAIANLLVFVEDVAAQHNATVSILTYDEVDKGDRRWEFKIAVDSQEFDIEMPGLPIERVRWMDEPSQNIWNFPRLYVDSSSWVWKYAISACEPE